MPARHRGILVTALIAVSLTAGHTHRSDGYELVAPAPTPASDSTAAPATAPTTTAPTTASTTASSTTTSTVPEPRQVSLVASGDVLLHEPLWHQAAADATAQGRRGHDFVPLLEGIRPVVEQADLAICHLETPLAPPGGPFAGYPTFSVPPAIAPALAEVGYDACTTASNHSFDGGASGVDRTLDRLDAAGLAHAGTARTPAEKRQTTLLRADDVTVALLSYSYGFNGIPAPNGQAWRANLIAEPAILADAARARQRGADLVVVSLHWGNEYDHEPSSQQLELAPRLIASPDVDLLLGHHAHVVQPVEHLRGGWVVYGMGNSVANQETLGPEKAEGILVKFTFTEDPSSGDWTATRARFAPTLLDRTASPRRLVLVADELARPEVEGTRRARLQAAWDRTLEVVYRRDATGAGLGTMSPQGR